MNEELIHITSQLSAHYFEGVTSLSLKEGNSINDLRYQLSQIISYLLDHDIQKLINIMYRVDIDERKFKEALISQNVADSVANLVLERFIKKAELRLKYKTH